MTVKDFTPIQKTEDTQIRVALKDYKNSQYVDIRQWWKPEDKDEYLPTKNGITIPVKDTLDYLNEFVEQVQMIQFALNGGESPEEDLAVNDTLGKLQDD